MRRRLGGLANADVADMYIYLPRTPLRSQGARARSPTEMDLILDMDGTTDGHPTFRVARCMSLASCSRLFRFWCESEQQRAGEAGDGGWQLAMVRVAIVHHSLCFHLLFHRHRHHRHHRQQQQQQQQGLSLIIDYENRRGRGRATTQSQSPLHAPAPCRLRLKLWMMGTGDFEFGLRIAGVRVCGYPYPGPGWG